MTVFFITRHPGALDWLNRQEFPVDIILSHLDLSVIKHGDVVIGLLPVHLAAAVCSSGADYWHISMELPYEARGKELTADEMDTYDARLERFIITLGSQ
ncbi:CRISPR-associated protein Csx16 [Endozoicomonas sp.]|uniref:CRISPR-associated protein Csx16 n=1 Tax=Endozoicomonas sp. TaxID=1892382 RepID=UPI002884978B|nr:CRISPR-associated protein Csx16 [Endozoicomonas sp.]